MSFAEVFLRLGVSLVGWMVLYAYLLWLAAARVAGCAADGGEMYAVLLGLALLAAPSGFAVRATRPFAEVHALLRWLAVPLALLAPLALATVWQVFGRVHGEGTALCSALAPPAWQQAWVAVQLAALGTIFVVLARLWRAHRGADGQ